MSIGNQPSITNNIASKTISVTATAGQTLFTVTGGYRINQLSVYRNGTRLVDALDYTARDGSTVTLLSPASVSDVLEFQVFDDFRVADALNVNSGGTVNGAVTIVSAATTALLVDGNARVTGILTVGNSSITFDGTNNQISVGGLNIAETGISGGTPDITARNITGVAATFTGNVSIAGTLTYEDVTNIDSVGLITARSGVVLTGGDVTLGTGVTASGASANTFTLSTNGSERLNIDSDGDINIDSGGVFYDATNNRLAIGTTSPSTRLSVVASSANGIELGQDSSLSTDSSRLFFSTSAGSNALQSSSGSLRFFTGSTAGSSTGNERLRIDSSGRLLVGTSTARTKFFNNYIGTNFQIEGTGSARMASIVSNNNDGGVLILGRQGGSTPGGNTLVANDDEVGLLSFQAADGSDFVVAASINCFVDGTPGNNDMPGRLVFSTTADGQSSPTERMRITNDGQLLCGTTNPTDYSLAPGRLQVVTNATSSHVIKAHATSTSFAENGGGVLFIGCQRSASTAYSFGGWYSGNDAGSISTDREFNFRGDGSGFCDGSWTGGGADYAEYFEWSDGNPDEEDRRGVSVVLDGNQIRPAVDGEDPIGVISGNPSVVGDAAWNKWSGKYLRDDFGTYILEDYEVVNEEGETVVQQRRKLNSAYDPDHEYVNREDRPEWDCVGLMGKLRIRKGQPTGSRWIKMRDISDSVEEWLVR